jgi:quercetin dioxygenase-like cupin family protein
MQKLTAGTWVENPVTQERDLLIKLPSETNGRYFELEYVNQPFTGKGTIPLHYHPTYTERFDILIGKARYLLGKEEHTASPGDQVTFPPLIPHLHPWSDSKEELRVRMVSEANPPDLAGLKSALNTGITLFGLARDGKVNKNGLPNLLQAAVLGRSIMPGTYPASLSPRMAQMAIGFLATVGYMAGYRVSYPKYGEV